MTLRIFWCFADATDFVSTFPMHSEGNFSARFLDKRSLCKDGLHTPRCREWKIIQESDTLMLQNPCKYC